MDLGIRMLMIIVIAVIILLIVLSMYAYMGGGSIDFWKAICVWCS